MGTVGKSTFQAKEVKFDDLIVINESNKYCKWKEQVDTYTTIQADLESGFRPDVTKPIQVTIAADAHRSSSRSKTINCKTILTRTVAFHVKDPSSREQNTENFEKKLKEWLKQQGCSKYDKTTTTYCIQYLNELGGVTHYVSSITLGAINNGWAIAVKRFIWQTNQKTTLLEGSSIFREYCQGKLILHYKFSFY